jgi:hypothetical protein
VIVFIDDGVQHVSGKNIAKACTMRPSTIFAIRHQTGRLAADIAALELLPMRRAATLESLSPKQNGE